MRRFLLICGDGAGNWNVAGLTPELRIENGELRMAVQILRICFYFILIINFVSMIRSLQFK